MRFYTGDGRFFAEGFGILSRKPISADTFLPPRHGLFGACIVQVESGADSVQIANVHLQPILNNGGVVGALAAFDAMEETHTLEIAHICDHLQADMPTVIAGDFNSFSTLRAPAFLRERGLVDSFAQVHAQPDSEITWHWPIGLGELSFRIDYIFHSPDIVTRDSRIVRSGGSDHHLVVSHLQLSAQP
jgi:endonuclease/exonuclease/phosphatase family metal-dependent hydrolase